MLGRTIFCNDVSNVRMMPDSRQRCVRASSGISPETFSIMYRTSQAHDADLDASVVRRSFRSLLAWNSLLGVGRASTILGQLEVVLHAVVNPANLFIVPKRNEAASSRRIDLLDVRDQKRLASTPSAIRDLNVVAEMIWVAQPSFLRYLTRDDCWGGHIAVHEDGSFVWWDPE